MPARAITAAVAVSLVAGTAAYSQDQRLNLYWARHYETDEALYANFTKATGQHEAFALADEIAVMRAGRIVQWDSAYNLYHRPADRFVGQGSFLPGRVTRTGQVEVELGALQGEVHMVGGAGRPPDGAPMPVDVLLRPDDDASPLKAQVLSKAFRGAEILYTLRLSSGAELLSLVPSHHNHAVGEAIGVRLAADHVIVFPRAT